MGFHKTIAVVMVGLLSLPFPVGARESSDVTLWSALVQKGIAARKRNATGQAVQYLDLAIAEAEKFKQPDLRLAGCLHMRAMLLGSVFGLPIAGTGALPPPTPPWGTVPPAPDLSIERNETGTPGQPMPEPTGSSDAEAQVRRALNICSRIPEVSPQFIANCQYDLARLQLAKGDYDGAESTLNKAVITGETAGGCVALVDILFVLGYILDTRGKLAQADRTFARATDLCQQKVQQSGCSNLPYMLRRRATYALWYERFDDAQLLLNKIILISSHKNDSSLNELVAESHYDLGCINLVRENYSQALAQFQKALDCYQRLPEQTAQTAQKAQTAADATAGEDKSPSHEPSAPAKSPPAPEKTENKPRSSGIRGLLRRALEKKTQAPSKQDDMNWSTPPDEPIRPTGFPPVPQQSDLPGTSSAPVPQPVDVPTSSPPGDDDASSPLMPIFQVPFYCAIAPFEGDSFSAGDAFSSKPNPPIDVTNIEVLESEKLSPSEILAALFQPSNSELQLHRSWYGCAYWPNENATMRMIAMLLGKTRGADAGLSMDTMANAISGANDYLPENRAAIAQKKTTDNYSTILSEQIDRVWSPPACKRSMQARLSLTVSQSGQLAGVTLTQSSGDALLDQSAIKAVSRAAPFSRPPAGVSTQPVELSFDYHILNLPGETLAPLRHVYVTPPPDWVLDRRLYAEAVQSKIRRFWKPPAHAPSAQASVHMQVGSTGELVHFCMVRSSKEAAWDRSVMTAIAESGPFWRLPNGIGRTMETWLDFNTSPRKRQKSAGTIKVSVKPTGYRKTDLTGYFRHVQQRVRMCFFPPVERKSEASVAKFRIKQDGSVAELKIIKSSGSIAADQEALKAIERVCFYAPPLGAPQSIEVEFTFACHCGASWALSGEPASAAKGNKTQSSSTVLAKLDLESWLDRGSSVAKSSSTHEMGPDADIDFEPYMADLNRRIKRAWSPPSGSESNRIIALFKIYEDGTISDLRLDRSSGSAVADQAAIKAIQAAAPFRTLPEGAPPYVDIQFTFSYHVFGGTGSASFRAL